MSNTIKGFICDVCGEKIILIPGIKLRPFMVKGIRMLFHVHSTGDCYVILKRANKERNWKLLCDGPLKEAYFSACKEQGIKT